MEAISQTSKTILILFVKSYQYIISPLLGPRCRFYPSCSNYAIDAFRQYNIFKSFYFIVRRIMRCHPFSAGGYDPVPLKKTRGN